MEFTAATAESILSETPIETINEEEDENQVEEEVPKVLPPQQKQSKPSYETTHFPCSQIFREKIPKELLVEFLNFVAPIKTEQNEYVLNTECFKRCQNNMEKARGFLAKFATYYYSSKQYYVNRVFTAKTLINMIRQICKSHKLDIRSTIHYIFNDYEIEWIISGL